MGLDERLAFNLDRLREQGRYRNLRPVSALAGGRIEHQGQTFINLAGNDYLGLATNHELLKNFYRQLGKDNLFDHFGAGATASRLMTGNHPVNEALEEALARLYGRPVLVFNSGYHANIGILPALARKGDLILADKLCHASLIDGMRLSRARVIRYPHLDLHRLETILSEQRHRYDRVFLVTESIFSMDGDEADLIQLVELRERFDAVLYVDEAHAVGMRGQDGLGLAEEQGVARQIDLLVGTFGKAWAGQGAFVVCNTLIREYLINTARSLIFSTGLPPVNLSWLLFVAERIVDLERERKHVRALAHTLRRALRNQGLETRGSSHIVPVLIGEDAATMQVAGRLQREGFWVGAVRPPTVPKNTARLRLSLTASLTNKDIAAVPALIASAMQECGCRAAG